MTQMTLAATRGFEKRNRATRKAEFLARMDRLMPWAGFCAVIEPHYPKAGNGRPPVGLERMLRMYGVANWFNLADGACEDALYDDPVFREFCRIDPGRERVPDATTLLHFRHLPECHGLGAALFARIGELLLANGVKRGIGTDSQSGPVHRQGSLSWSGEECQPRLCHAGDAERQQVRTAADGSGASGMGKKSGDYPVSALEWTDYPMKIAFLSRFRLDASSSPSFVAAYPLFPQTATESIHARMEIFRNGYPAYFQHH